MNLCLEVHRDFLDGKKRVALENPKLREELTKQLATVKANKKFTSTDQAWPLTVDSCLLFETEVPGAQIRPVL